MHMDNGQGPAPTRSKAKCCLWVFVIVAHGQTFIMISRAERERAVQERGSVQIHRDVLIASGTVRTPHRRQRWTVPHPARRHQLLAVPAVATRSKRCLTRTNRMSAHRITRIKSTVGERALTNSYRLPHMRFDRSIAWRTSFSAVCRSAVGK
jgi:hypothetical protein